MNDPGSNGRVSSPATTPNGSSSLRDDRQDAPATLGLLDQETDNTPPLPQVEESPHTLAPTDDRIVPPDDAVPALQRMRGLLHTRRFQVRLAIASVLVVASLFTNRSFLGWGLFVVFAILVVPIGRARSFLLSFVPYGAVWFIFTAFRSLADETILARTLNTHVPRLERALFSGQLPSIRLQDRLFDPNHLLWYDYFLTSVHWSYFFIPHLVAIRLWQKNPALFKQFFGAMTLLLTVGLFIYFLIPSNPPWLAPEPVNSPSAATVHRVMATVGRQLGGGVYNASYRVIGESNAIAAMPSIHMAFTFLLVFPAWSARRRWRLLALAYSGLMGLALVYLGEHYVVDVAVGMLITTYGWFAAGAWLSRIAPMMAGRRTPRFAPGSIREAEA